MIEVAVYNMTGEETGKIKIDESLLGGEVNPSLLKQAYVRYHANQRQGSAQTKNRAQVRGSTRKLYKQKGTGNARRGDKKSNILRGGGHGHSKMAHSFSKDMPHRQRRLANRNALLAKLVDGEVKLIEGLGMASPATKTVESLLTNLNVDRTCLIALEDTRDNVGRSARNLQDASLTQIDRLNVFSLLNHRYLVADKAAFEAYIGRITASQQPKEVA